MKTRDKYIRVILDWITFPKILIEFIFIDLNKVDVTMFPRYKELYSFRYKYSPMRIYEKLLIYRFKRRNKH